MAGQYSDIKAEMRATPRNSILGALSDYLSGARRLGDKAQLPLVGGLGSLFLGESPEELDDIAYGNYPMEIPEQGRLPQFKPGRDMQTLDLLGALPFLNTTAKFARSLPAAVRHGAEEFAQASFAGAPGVVKRKGGNWLPGSIQDMTNEIESPMWLSGEMIDEAGGPGTWASVVQRGGDNDIHPWMRANEPELYDKIRGPVNTAADSWLNKQLARYMQNEMGTPEDPIRALAERGVTHAPEAMNQYDQEISPSLAQRRYKAGFPAEGMAQSPLAKQWEIASDASIYEKTAGKLRREASNPSVEYARGEAQRILDENPWMSKLPDNEKLYGVTGGSEDLGFDHLMDELRNAMNPESGLPPELQLRPESLSRVSVPQAVERVAKINDWRAKQMELQQAARGPNPAEHLHKEYPEGFKWVQLKSPKEIPGYSAQNGYLVDPQGVPTTLRENEVSRISSDPRYKQLQDALKFEGDTMGHCVGGYCDDVAGGRSNIYSLRDAKGQPHVTIETAPTPTPILDKWTVRESLTPKELETYFEAANMDGVYSIESQLKAAGLYDTLVDRLGIGQPPKPDRIVQIKGKQNRAPIADYLPFVQDFVKSQPWAEVGDLGNAGLVDLRRNFERSRPEELQQMLQHFGSQYVNPSDAAGTPFENLITPLKGYAHGGHVGLHELADRAYQEIQGR